MIFNRLDLSPKGTRWNGTATERPALMKILAEVPKLGPEPVMVFVPAPETTCADVSAFRQLLETSLLCSAKRHCIEYSQAEWVQWHPPLPPCDADCQAYGRAGGSDRLLTAAQRSRLKRNYIDKYGFVPW